MWKARGTVTQLPYSGEDLEHVGMAEDGSD